ncbi:MCE family protein [Nocardioides sp. LHG3406-4]|uniref:MCE family protein n=1 Tax=Nocardioides sp. LHG3406-4 TaxID=2804575 RepID=UPI003CE787CB
MDGLRKLLVPAVIGALVVAAALTMFGGEKHKTLVAHFPRVISVYEGSDVRVLGVSVGTVTEVRPSGTDVVVTMEYDADTKLSAGAKAAVISPSIVGDRFVQITPVYTGGEVLADGVELDVEHTAVPLELDQIYSSIDSLTVALGPTGANRQGALSDLLDTTAENFGGQGEAFNTTIENFGKLTKTLDDNKEELFGSTAQLGAFIKTLADNDQTVRDFNTSIAQVSDMLAGERQELKASLKNLAGALTQVSSFVQENREILGRNIKGLNRVSKVLVKQRDALDEVLRTAPLALNNLALTYNPQAGTLDTRANIGELINQISADPATLLCGLTGQADKSGRVCDLIKDALPRSAALGGVATRSQPLTDPTLGGLVEVER